jgi:hypothetical protein
LMSADGVVRVVKVVCPEYAMIKTTSSEIRQSFNASILQLSKL